MKAVKYCGKCYGRAGYHRVGCPNAAEKDFDKSCNRDCVNCDKWDVVALECTDMDGKGRDR